MNLSERLRKMIETVTPDTRRFVALEEKTQIKAETWRTWWNRGGRASADMIEAVSQAWPEYAFWIVTGVDDFANGHTSPIKDLWRENGIPLYERTSARDLFLKEIQYELWQNANPAPATENAEHEYKKNHFCLEIEQLHILRNAQAKAITSLLEQAQDEAIAEARNAHKMSL